MTQMVAAEINSKPAISFRLTGVLSIHADINMVVSTST